MKNKKLQIIAEIAQGYEGDFTKAKLFIKAAKSANADAVKFQLVYADELATKQYRYYDFFKSLEMPFKNWDLLNNYAKELGVELILDIFGEKSLEVAEKMKLDSIKIHATDLSNIDLIDKISSSTLKNIIIGSGGSEIDDIIQVVKILNNKNLILMHGFQGYPTKIKDNKISRLIQHEAKIKLIHKNFVMGYAPHPGKGEVQDLIGIVAIGSGAEVIERHLTLGKVMRMEDYESALNPDEFYNYVNKLNAAYLSYGKHYQPLKLSKSEKSYQISSRKDVVASKNLKKGNKLLRKDLVLKRTGDSNSIKSIDLVIGRVLKTDISKNQAILNSNLKNE